jgi:mevalonate kinase
MNSVTVSAPGKLLLMGEHAVVYRHPCLVTAVSERLTVTIEESVSDGVHFVTPGVSDTRFIEAALQTATKYWKQPFSHLTITTASAFSANYGLGSSAAVTVAVLFALGEYFVRPVSKKELFSLAYEAILSVQRVGSGVDAASAVWGGTIWYDQLGKTIEPIPHDTMPLIIGFSGVKADTATIIADVAKKYTEQQDRVARIFTAIAQLTADAKEKIKEGDWERVGKLMDFNQEYLRDLGVSSQRLESLIVAAKEGGAWGAKLSGAGGGDCMIAIVPMEKQAGVARAIEQAGGQVIHITPQAPGVRREP